MIIIRKLLKQKSLYVLSLLMFFLVIRLAAADNHMNGNFDAVSELSQIGVPIKLNYRQINFNNDTKIKILYRQVTSSEGSSIVDCRKQWLGPMTAEANKTLTNSQLVGDSGTYLGCLRGLYLNNTIGDASSNSIKYDNIKSNLMNAEINNNYYNNGLGMLFQNPKDPSSIVDYFAGGIPGSKTIVHSKSFDYIDALFDKFSPDHTFYSFNNGIDEGVVTWSHQDKGYIRSTGPESGSDLGYFEIMISFDGGSTYKAIYRVSLKYDGYLYYGADDNDVTLTNWKVKAKRHMVISSVSNVPLSNYDGNIKLYTKLIQTGPGGAYLYPWRGDKVDLKAPDYNDYKLSIMLVCGNKSKSDSDEPYYNCDTNNIPAS